MEPTDAHQYQHNNWVSARNWGLSSPRHIRDALQLTNCVFCSFGPTIVGEWGQADTDCTPHLNNVNLSYLLAGLLAEESLTQSIYFLRNR